MLVKGVLAPDVNVVLAWLMVTALLVVVANLVADIVLARIDPWVRLWPAARGPPPSGGLPAAAQAWPAWWSVVVLLVAGSVGGRVWRYDYDEITAEFLTGPSWQHPMGTDNPGHDMLALVLRGVQKSVQVALVVAALSTLMGVVVGGLAGFFGGVVDNLLMRLADVVLIIPGIAVLAVLTASVQDVEGNWFLIGLILSALMWVPTARLLRAWSSPCARRPMSRRDVRPAPVLARIIVRHVVPGAAGLIITSATLTVAAAIQAEAALTFLGLGITSPDTSLGRLVASGLTSASTRPWLFYFPGLTIVVLVLAVNFVGDGLRRALDRTADLAGPGFGP